MATVVEMMSSNAVMVAILAIVICLLTKVWNHPAVIHTLWVLLLIKLLTPPIAQVPLDWLADLKPNKAEQGLDAAVEHGMIFVELRDIGTGSSGNDFQERHWRGYLIFISLCGSGIYFALLLVRGYQFNRLLTDALPPPRGTVDLGIRLSRSLGLRRCPTIRFVPGKVSPMVWGFGRKTQILLPSQLFQHLDDDAQQTLLAHELAHVWRGDHWVRLLEAFVTGIYWWHPVVWWSRRELHELEELSCDQVVLRTLPQARRTYAVALMDTIDFLTEARYVLPPVASGVTPTNCLKRRITMVMSGKGTKQSPRIVRHLVVLLAVVCLPLGASWAGDDEPEGANEPTAEVSVESPQSIELTVEAQVSDDRPEPIELTVTAEPSPQVELGVVELNEQKKSKTRTRYGIATDGTVKVGKGLRVFYLDADKNKGEDVDGDGDIDYVIAKGAKPKSITIKFDDGSTQEVAISDNVVLTFDTTKRMIVVGSKAVAPHRLAISFDRDDGKAYGQIVNFKAAKKAANVRRATTVKKDDRLDRLEEMLIRLQKELKQLRKERTSEGF